MEDEKETIAKFALMLMMKEIAKLDPLLRAKPMYDLAFRRHAISKSEVSMTTDDFMKIAQDVRKDALTDGILILSKKGLLNIGVNDKGEMDVEPTKLGNLLFGKTCKDAKS